jgi:hypothetical protein
MIMMEKMNRGKYKQQIRKGDSPVKDNQEGYPPYPSDEDIYDNYQKEKNINPDDPSGIISSPGIFKTGTDNEKDFNDDLSGNDLDIPGSELDDESEITGSEDEENNYYSLGGDDHTDLDEHNMELNP